MAEYIERAKAIECIKPHVKVQTVYGEAYMQAIAHAVDILEIMPTADVQPVKRGFWRKTNDIFYRYCSVCGTKTDIAYSNIAKYCAECGAKMDLPETTKG